MKRRTTVRKTSVDGEAQLIERIARAVPSVKGLRRGGQSGGFVRLGIGDDAAVVSPDGRRDWVFSCDAFLEGVHFLADRHPADSVGYKALARATSDLAAMGARPRFFLLTLALPSSRTGKWLDAFLGGMGRAARELGMKLAGGDTTENATVSISVTVVGDVARGRAAMRSGARPGDVIYVSGTLGRAALGLVLVKNGARLNKRAALLLAHLYPKIPVNLGAWLAGNRIASAMMDISDGLSTDLGRLCEASGVGARIWAERVPCVAVPAAIRTTFGLKLKPLEMALHGGEDYELLFTAPRELVKRLRNAPGFSALKAIGEIERGDGVTLVEAGGKAVRLASRGWDPFRKKKR